MTRVVEHSERGFTLLEMVGVIALVAMLAAVLLPFVPRNTSRARLQAYALQAASLLKADRNAAIRRGSDVSTLVDAPSRAIRSGATAQLIRFPADGMSCGGAIALTRLDSSYEIRVNWLTGRVEIVSHSSRAN